MTDVIVILADGLEEVEALTPVDYMRRAGIAVTTLGLGGTLIEGSHGITIKADMDFKDFKGEARAIVIPGGMPGSSHIAADERVIELIREYHDDGRLIAAICAAPALVLGRAGILKDKKYTCYPGYEEKAGLYGEYSSDRVVQDQNVITGCGVGGAAEFSARIIASLKGEDKAKEIMKVTLQSGY